MEITIDEGPLELTPEEFVQYYQNNKAELDVIPTLNLNSKIQIYRGDTKYKIGREKGKIYLKKVSIEYSPHELYRIIGELKQRITELEYNVEQLKKERENPPLDAAALLKNIKDNQTFKSWGKV